MGVDPARKRTLSGDLPASPTFSYGIPISRSSADRVAEGASELAIQSSVHPYAPELAPVMRASVVRFLRGLIVALRPSVLGVAREKSAYPQADRRFAHRVGGPPDTTPATSRSPPKSVPEYRSLSAVRQDGSNRYRGRNERHPGVAPRTSHWDRRAESTPWSTHPLLLSAHAARGDRAWRPSRRRSCAFRQGLVAMGESQRSRPRCSSRHSVTRRHSSHPGGPTYPASVRARA
jgi:hypothetical protein